MTTPLEQAPENTQCLEPESVLLPTIMATRADRAAALTGLTQLLLEDMDLTVDLI